MPANRLTRPALFVTALLVAAPTSARAQDLYHPIPWESADDVTCVRMGGARPRAEVDEHLTAIGRGESPAPALELIASCEVSRRDVGQAFNRGGLVRHRAGDYPASSSLFTEALRADPSLLPARFNLACAHARLGRAGAAIAELGELARAGDEGRRWLRRVRTDPDLASVRANEDVVAYIAGRQSNWHPPPIAAPGVPVPAARGPVWEPIEGADWAPFRELLVASGRFGERRGFRGAEAWVPSHPELAGLASFTSPAFWRPSPGVVFLVVPFSIPGPNRREGTQILWWTGSRYALACHEYCDGLSSPREREARFREQSPSVLRLVRCREGASTCAARRVVADGHVLRYRMASLLSGIAPP